MRLASGKQIRPAVLITGEKGLNFNFAVHFDLVRLFFVCCFDLSDVVGFRLVSMFLN